MYYIVESNDCDGVYEHTGNIFEEGIHEVEKRQQDHITTAKHSLLGAQEAKEGITSF